MNLSRAAFFLPPPPAITTRSLSTCAGSKARDQSGSDSGGETGLELFSRVFIDRRARIVRARQSGPFARELRKAMQARTTREPLVPSYVLTSISLLRLSPFLSIVPLSLSPSLSLPFSPTPLSSSLALNHTCPPSLSPFLTFTFLSPSHCIDPPLRLSFSLSPLHATLPASSVLRSFSLFRAQWSFFIPIPTLSSYFFRLFLSSLSLSYFHVTSHRPSFPRVLALHRTPLSIALSLFLSLLLSRFTSYAISPSRIFIIVHPVSVRTILPTPTTRVFSLPTSLIPHFIGVYLCSLCVSCRPPTVLHLSLSRTLFLSPSLSIAPFHRCTLRLLSLRFSLSFSLFLPRVSSIVDLHFSWPFALLLPHECILSGIRRNVLAGVPLITVWSTITII